MDHMTFHHDTVLSDVHMLLPNTRHLMTRLNCAAQPVFLTKFRILSEVQRADSDSGKCVKAAEERDGAEEDEDGSDEEEEEEEEAGSAEPCLDVDGDLDVQHRPRRTPQEGRDLVCPIILQQSSPDLEQEDGDTDDEADKSNNNIIRIEHTMATPLEDVGKQVWRGAFLMADFILSEPLLFRGSTVLELGAGTGLTSIVMATLAKTVYCTDVGEDLLSMCKRNVTLNRHMIESAGGDVRVRQLDWLQYDLCTDADVEFSWTEDEVADLYDNTKIIIAADVCYDDELTDGLFRTLYRLCSHLHHACTLLFSIEKRFNFTLRHMDVSCDAYNHFTRCLSQLQDEGDHRCSFTVQQIPSDFTQFLLYERIEHLELWKVTVTPLQNSETPHSPKV